MISPLPPASPVPPAPPQPLDRNQVAVKLLDLTPGLKTIPDATIITGRIVESRSDGTVRIETPQGDVTAQLPANVQARIGQRVDVTLPPGSPPRDAAIAAAKPEPQPQPQKTNPDPAAQVPRQPQTPPVVDDQLRQIANQRATTGEIRVPQTPQIDQVVQIKTITAAQARAIIQQVQQNIQQTLLQMAPTTPLSVIDPDGPLPSTAHLSASLSLSGHLPVPTNSQISPLPPTLFLFQPTGSTPQTTMNTPINVTAGAVTTLAPQLPGFTDADGLLPLPTIPQGSGTAVQTFLARVVAMDIAPLPVLIDPDQPTSPFPVSTSPQSPGTVSTQAFTVLGATNQGHVILQPQSPLQLPVMTGAIGSAPTSELYILQAPADGLPPGARLTLQPLHAVPGKPATGLPALAPLLMDDINALLDALPPQLAREIFGGAGRVPIPAASNPQHMGAAVLFFLAAMRSGDILNWLGDRAVENLRRGGKGGLIDKLSSTFETVRTALSERVSTEWKSYLLPFQFQHDIKPALLHVRADTSPRDDKGKGQGQRFVVDVTLDRMGAVQLDLLYRPGVLDTILRTELPLSRAMAEVLVEKYAAAMGQTNLTGQLFFQNGIKHWVTIDESRETLQVLA